MCGRYWIEPEGEADLRILVEQALPQNALMKSSGEIRPGDSAPVIARNRKLLRAAFPMIWNFPIGSGKYAINIRGETADKKPLFKESAKERRCAVPASWYYEWQEQEKGKKAKYRFFSEDGGLLYMAGLYSLAEGAARFAVVTRPAFFEAAAVHPRMPALLSRDTVDAWIFGELGLEPLVTGPAKALCFALDGPSFPAK